MKNEKWKMAHSSERGLREVMFATAVPVDRGRVDSRYSKRVPLECKIELLQ
jgi:hypothetical protein